MKPVALHGDPHQRYQRRGELGHVEQARVVGKRPDLPCLVADPRDGAARAAIPVEVDLRLPRRLPEALEAAAYYVCSEACTNAVKHARASGLWLTVADEESRLTVVVRDDGIGGACIECQEEASGLGGLVDRVEALGGTLAIVSPDGGGTTLTAVFPLEPEPGL